MKTSQAELKLHNPFFPFNPSSPDFAFNGPHLYPSQRPCLCRPAKQMWFCLFLSPLTSLKGWLSLLARFTPFREEHTRHQVAVTTPSSGSPPVIKQEQRIIHRRERGLFSSQADTCSFKTLDCRSLSRQRRTHNSNGSRSRRKRDFRTRHIHCTMLWSRSSEIWLNWTFPTLADSWLKFEDTITYEKIEGPLSFTFNSVCVSYRLLHSHKVTEVALPSLPCETWLTC